MKTFALFNLPTHLLKLCRSLWSRICAGPLNGCLLPWWTPERGQWVWVNTEHRSRAANLRSASWIGNSWAQALPCLLVPSPQFVSRQEERLLFHFGQTTEVAKSGNQSLSTAWKKQRANPSCGPAAPAEVWCTVRKCECVFLCRRENHRQTQPLENFCRQGFGCKQQPWQLLSASKRNRRVIKNSPPCAPEASKGGEECRAAWTTSSTLLPCWDKHRSQKGQLAATKCCFESGGTSLVR